MDKVSTLFPPVVDIPLFRVDERPVDDNPRSDDINNGRLKADLAEC